MIENEEREGYGSGTSSAALARGQDSTGGFHILIMETEFLPMGGLASASTNMLLVFTTGIFPCLKWLKKNNTYASLKIYLLAITRGYAEGVGGTLRS